MKIEAWMLDDEFPRRKRDDDDDDGGLAINGILHRRRCLLGFNLKFIGDDQQASKQADKI